MNLICVQLMIEFHCQLPVIAFEGIRLSKVLELRLSDENTSTDTISAHGATSVSKGVLLGI